MAAENDIQWRILFPLPGTSRGDAAPMMTSPSPSASMPAADHGNADLGVVGHDPDALGAGGHSGLAAYPVPPPRDILDAAGELLRALAAPVRIAIVLQLRESHRCVHELVDALGVP